MSVPEFKPFPIDALGPVVAHLVREAADSLDVDPSFIAAPALSVLGAGIGNSFQIQLTPDWLEAAIVWAVIVGNSSTRKTPALKAVTRPMWEMQATFLSDYRREVEDSNARLSGGKSKGKNQDDPPPKLAHVIVGDCTIEALGAILNDNPHGILKFSDELANWFESFRRYKSNSAPQWLELANCGTLKIDRKTGEPRMIFVENACACIAGGIQPRVLRSILSEEFFTNGLAARLLFAFPPKMRRQDGDSSIGGETKAAYSLLIRRLYDRSRSTTAITAIPLDTEAKAVWRKFVKETNDRQFEADDDEAAAIGKLEAYAARFALIRHCADHAEVLGKQPTAIGAGAMRAGIAIAGWFEGEMQRIYAMLKERPEDKANRDLCDYIRGKGGRITARDLHRNQKTKFPTTDSAMEALATLVRAGHGKWDYSVPGPNGGHPSSVFVLADPTVRQYDETPENAGDGEVSS